MSEEQNPLVQAMVRVMLRRWAAMSCECAARRKRTLPGAEFPLKPEHMKCQPCVSAEALARMNHAG